MNNIFEQYTTVRYQLPPDDSTERKNLCNGTISDNIEEYIGEIDIKNMKLKKHQLQIINEMCKLESNIISLNQDEEMKTEIGILSNKVGSGKSFCILGLITTKKKLEKQEFVKKKYGNSITVYDKRSSIKIEGNNLIVCPHHLMKEVWVKYVKEHTDLKYTKISNKHFPIDWESMKTYDVVLCSSSNYNNFMNECPYTWSRVVFDEADTIKIPKCIYPKARFVWFVTSSLQNLLFPNGYYAFTQNIERNCVMVRNIIDGLNHTGYIKDTFISLKESNPLLLSKIILKQSDVYVDNILQLPDHKEIIYKCASPLHVDVLNGVVGVDIMNLLNAGDYDGAIERLGCTLDTKDNIIKLVCKDLEEQICNLKLKKDFLNTLTVRSVDREAHMQKVKKTQSKIDAFMERIEIITKKIEELNVNKLNEFCPVCYNTLTNSSVILNCCMNIFCSSCITKLITLHKNNCPMCRTVIETKNILQIKNKTKKQVTLMSKEDQVIDIINKNPNSKVIIFSSYDTSFSKICVTLSNYKIRHKKLIGNQHAISKTITEFNDNDSGLNVLMLNSSYYGCGLNLTKTTDLIFYHKMSNDMKQQVIGRAQRLGRKTNLNIHYMYYENEME